MTQNDDEAVMLITGGSRGIGAATAQLAARGGWRVVHAYIREWFSRLDKEISANLCLLYGGSVKASNANGLFVMDDIDGALVGGASLDAGEFLKNIG